MITKRRVSTSLRVTLLMALALTPWSAYAASGSLCEPLARIVRDQPNGFASYQGEKVMDNMFRATESILDATSCTTNPSDKTFVCSFHIVNGERVEAKAKAFAKRVAACFSGAKTSADQGMFGPRYVIETPNSSVLVNGDIEEKAIGLTIGPK